jgi:cephalosporin hydroxylase
VSLPDAVVVDAFHSLYYHAPDTWMANTFLGYPVQQSPFDLHLYQEVLARLRPAFVVQTGVAAGGSVLYLASMLDLVGAPPSAVVVGVDVRLTDSARRLLAHRRVRLVEGDSADPAVAARVRDLLPAPRGMVSLDSDHSRAHVAREIAAYRDLVEVGSYLVVEDANVNGHPVYPEFGPGPREAADEFLAEDPRFVRDDALWRRGLLSFHQGGWLRRVS